MANPGPLSMSAFKVRTNNAAPTTRINVRAICNVTMALRRRTAPKAVPPRSRSDSANERRPACKAGAKPLKIPAAMLTRNANSRRRKSMPDCKAFAAVSRGRNAMSARTASGASATPSKPPASAMSRLSARSWRPMRPRDAPRARRVLISRSRAEPRARKRPATFRQARHKSTAVAANSTQSGCDSLR